MTKFVESFTTQQLIPPWISKGARVWAFVIETDLKCMQNYLDTHFNSPGPDYSPYHYLCSYETGHGLLMVADHPNFSSGARKGVEGWDTLAHKEIYWSFPATRHPVTKDNLLGRGEPVWIQPFYFDDSSSVMFASREIWGSEKQVGQITLQQGETPDHLHIDLATQGFAKFSPRTKARDLAVLHVEIKPRKNNEPVDLAKIFLADKMGEFVGTLLAEFELLSEKTANIPNIRRSMEINTLKQFRDVFDMRAAVYRAIVASQVTRTNVKNVTYYSSDQIELDFMWSDTMKEQFEQLFGLTEPCGKKARFGHKGKAPPPGDLKADWKLKRQRKRVEFAVSFTSDALFEVVETLHTYGAPGAR